MVDYNIDALRKENQSLEQELVATRALLESANSIIIRCDQLGTIHYVNEFGQYFFGYSSDELIGKNVMIIVPRQEKSTGRDLEALVKDILQNPERYQNVPSENVTKDGRTVWVSWTNKAILDEKGNIREILTIGNDITELKQAEQALKESEKMFRSLFEHSPEAVFLTIPDGQVLAANPAACALFGYSNEQFKKINRAKVLDEMHPNFLSALEERKRTGVVKDQELTAIRKNGEKFPVEMDSVILPGEPVKSFVILRDIRERKKMEKELTEAKEILQAAMDQSPAGIAIADAPDGKLRYVNKAGLDIRGGEYQDAVPEVTYDQYPDKWQLFDLDGRKLSPDEVPLARAVLFGETNSREFIVRHESGSDHIVLGNAAPIKNKEGQIHSGIVVFTDITERKRAEERLRKAEQKIRLMVENSTNLFYMHTTDHVLIYVSPQSRQFFDCEPEEAMVRWTSFLTDNPLNQEGFLATQRAIDTGEVQPPYEVECIGKKGRKIWVEVNEAPIIEDGKVVAISGSLTDVTKRKQTEKELQYHRKLLEKSQELGDIGSWDIDIDSNVITWTDETYKIFGVPIGTKVTYDTFIEIVHPEDRALVNQQWQAAVAGDPYDVEHRLLVHGKTKWVRQKAEVEFDDTGKAIRAIGFTQNITKRKRAEAERLSLEDQLHHAQKIESIGRLAGGVAHDYNNMLAVIIGNAELAQMKITSAHPLRDDLEEILTAAKRSRDITQKLLAFARKQTIEPKVLDLNTAVETMLKMLEKLLGENIELAWHPGEDIWSVEIDPSQLDQILANLCVNARDAIADTGQLIIETNRVVIDEDFCAEHAGFVPGDYVLLSVSDTGGGMDKITLEKIFEPFFTTKEPGAGTGLGLAMVYGVVKQSNGFINVYSEPGQGTTFKIYLPKYQGDVVEEKKPVADEAPKGRGETILVVEDEVPILKLVTAMLSELGYEVLSAISPKEALMVAKEHPGKIDLLVTDVIMPEMNGRELVDRLTLLCPDIKSLYMSGYTENTIAHHGVLDKGIRFIQKPFSRNEFCVKVREVLDTENAR